mgnify:CR=1 FL=1
MDIKLPLAVLLIAAGAIGLVVPNPGDDRLERAHDGASARTAQTNSDPEPRAALVQQPAVTWAEEVVLDREMDGHFYADVEIEGQSYRMMVDTGASVVALTEQDALNMGMTWFEEDIAPIARGASGPVNGVSATISHMAVGYHEAENVRAIIITDGGSISLLGQSFLSTLDNVQIAGDRMVLGN